MVNTIIKCVKRIKARHKVVCGNGYVHDGYKQACDEVLLMIDRIQKTDARKKGNKPTSPNNRYATALSGRILAIGAKEGIGIKAVNDIIEAVQRLNAEGHSA